MRRTLGALLSCAVLSAVAACGSATSSSTASGPDSPSPGSEVPGARTVLLSQTAAGGEVSAVARILDSPGSLARFTAQFRGQGLPQRVRQAADRLGGGGHVVVGAVVAVGCDRPLGVDVVYGQNSTVQLLPHEVASPLPECLAPVTTVALASVPGND
jgi:hypothetical protein